MSKKDQMNTKYSFIHFKSRKHTREAVEPNGAPSIKGALRGQDHCWEAKWILHISFHCELNCGSMLYPFGEGGCSSESMTDTEVAKEVVETLTMQMLTSEEQCWPKCFSRIQEWKSWIANGNV